MPFGAESKGAGGAGAGDELNERVLSDEDKMKSLPTRRFVLGPGLDCAAWKSSPASHMAVDSVQAEWPVDVDRRGLLCFGPSFVVFTSRGLAKEATNAENEKIPRGDCCRILEIDSALAESNAFDRTCPIFSQACTNGKVKSSTINPLHSLTLHLIR